MCTVIRIGRILEAKVKRREGRKARAEILKREKHLTWEDGGIIEHKDEDDIAAAAAASADPNANASTADAPLASEATKANQAELQRARFESMLEMGVGMDAVKLAMQAASMAPEDAELVVSGARDDAVAFTKTAHTRGSGTV